MSEPIDKKERIKQLEAKLDALLNDEDDQIKRLEHMIRVHQGPAAITTYTLSHQLNRVIELLEAMRPAEPSS